MFLAGLREGDDLALREGFDLRQCGKDLVPAHRSQDAVKPGDRGVGFLDDGVPGSADQRCHPKVDELASRVEAGANLLLQAVMLREQSFATASADPEKQLKVPVLRDREMSTA